MVDSPTMHHTKHTVVRFGIYEVDLDEGNLRKSGVRIKVQQQPFKVLQALLEHPGELITREQLHDRIWPDASFGDFDQAVNVAVAKLRMALGDSADNPRFIETVPRRGYRFIAPVAAEGGGDAPVLPETSNANGGHGSVISAEAPKSYLGKRTIYALVIATGVIIAGLTAFSFILRGARSVFAELHMARAPSVLHGSVRTGIASSTARPGMENLRNCSGRKGKIRVTTLFFTRRRHPCRFVRGRTGHIDESAGGGWLDQSWNAGHYSHRGRSSSGDSGKCAGRRLGP